jgi:hypothetical protein
MQDSEREDISNRIQAIINSATAIQIIIESTDGQELMQELHNHINTQA